MGGGFDADVTTVLVSALVAAIVTLMIEYLAKPTLEVRKERILLRHRQSWELLRALRVLITHLRWRLLALRATPHSAGLAEAMKSLSAELEAVGDIAISTWNEFPAEIQDLFVSAQAFYKGLFDLVLVEAPSASPDEVVHEVDIVLKTRATEFIVLEAFLRLSRWHFLRKRRLRRLAVAVAEDRRREVTAVDEPNGHSPGRQGG